MRKYPANSFGENPGKICKSAYEFLENSTREEYAIFCEIRFSRRKYRGA